MVNRFYLSYCDDGLADAVPHSLAKLWAAPITLYFAGAKQISTYPVSIPYHGMALNITLQSYNGWLDFGVIGCRRVMPDIADLGKYMQAAHAELLRRSREMAAEAPVEAPAKTAVSAPKAPTKSTRASKPAAAQVKAKAKTKSK